MTKRSAILAIVIGLSAAIGGGIVTVVYFLQPWRTCPYDDSPAACAMLPQDATVMIAAIFVGLVGVAVVGVGGVLLARRVVR